LFASKIEFEQSENTGFYLKNSGTVEVRLYDNKGNKEIKEYSIAGLGKMVISEKNHENMAIEVIKTIILKYPYLLTI